MYAAAHVDWDWKAYQSYDIEIVDISGIHSPSDGAPMAQAELRLALFTLFKQFLYLYVKFRIFITGVCVVVHVDFLYNKLWAPSRDSNKIK